MGIDNFFGSYQAQAGAVLLGGKKGRKKFVLYFIGHTDALIADAQSSLGSVWRCGSLNLDVDFAAFGHGLGGVLQKIQDDLLELLRVDGTDGGEFRVMAVDGNKRVKRFEEKP